MPDTKWESPTQRDSDPATTRVLSLAMRTAPRRLLFLVLLCTTLLIAARCTAEVTIDLRSAQVRLDQRGRVIALEPVGATPWSARGPAAFAIETQNETLTARSVERVGDRLTVNFGEGVRAEFQISEHPGYALFSLVRLQGALTVKRFRFFSLPLPPDAQQIDTINAARRDGWMAAVVGTDVNVVLPPAPVGVTRADRQGCEHQFLLDQKAKVGNLAARFIATCDSQPGGWSLQGKSLAPPLNLSGCSAVRLWVHGDGQGQKLKVQLADGAGGYRDDYVTIDFTGWRQVTLEHPALNTLRYDRVAAVNFYFNNLPANKTVCCGLDQVEALLGTDPNSRIVPLEDFEGVASALWASSVRTLGVETVAAHGITPASFALIVCPEKEFFQLLPEVQQAAGLPSPRPGGIWNKRSPWVQRSYLFLTNFSESDFEAGLALARRGGFDTILIGQQSWCESTGHYTVNRKHFPEGLHGLVRTVQRFKDAGFKVGLHFLAASVFPPDVYLTPVPDRRLVTGAETTLAAAVDTVADFLPTSSAPGEFPAEDGGYKGAGTIVRIGDELIAYGDRSLQRPFGFRGCRRGHLGTRASSHAAGERVRHLVRSFGYHLVDLDSTLFDEVTTNLAHVANACDVDMLYFDGAEKLQGDHGYYNGRLISGFYNKLKRKDILVQASSFGPYSWHIVARSASADGHGDLKGYLEQRSSMFDSFARRGMPLDIGWYYGYDPTCTPDMYEYVLGATIGYGASISFQISPAAAARNPFTSEILDLIARYEKMRLSGRVPQEMRERLRIDPERSGNLPTDVNISPEHRREYRLTAANEQEVFQRVVYSPWHDLTPEDAASQVWTVQVPAGPTRVGLQVHAQPGPWLTAGPSYGSPEAIPLETFDDLAPYLSGSAGRTNSSEIVREIGPGQAGNALPGVTQSLALSDEPGPAGNHYAVYSARSELSEAVGWSYISKRFDPPLDLSRHRGLGFWMRGDGQGGSFKVQLRDGKGAMDYYVANDFKGWRYQQLARPEQDSIDDSHVQSLTMYYNGLPAQRKVSCGIDDIRALSTLDAATISDPVLEVDGQQLSWQGTLAAGQYLFLWPGEPPRRYGLPVADPNEIQIPVPEWSLAGGEHSVRFTCRSRVAVPLRVRLTFQPDECHVIPPVR